MVAHTGAMIALAAMLGIALLAAYLAWRRGTRARDVQRDKMAAQRALLRQAAGAASTPAATIRRPKQNFGRR